MPQSDISTWFQFALQQMAAESYLDGIDWNNAEQVKIQLRLGNNRSGFPESGATRFTGTQTQGLQDQAFVDRYRIVDHHANDATGFSATLIKDLSDPTGKTFTLSFRSLEYQNHAQGGDWERDGRDGAAGEVATQGFAFGQLVSMERYYRELKANPTKLPPGAVLNITGYSLGGHLATVFTELHASEINHTYTFNGAGRGHISGGTTGLSEAERIREMLDVLEFNLLQLDPEGSMFRSGAGGNVQSDARYQAALLATKATYTTTLSTLPPGEVGTGAAFQKITQLFGHATSGVDTEVVANSGVHGPVASILIEGQPLLESVRERDYGNSHSITLIVDSLALQDLFLKVDPTLTQSKIEDLFKAISDQKADVTVLPGLVPLAEGNTLEQALDALRRVFHNAASGKPKWGRVL